MQLRSAGERSTGCELPGGSCFAAGASCIRAAGLSVLWGFRFGHTASAMTKSNTMLAKAFPTILVLLTMLLSECCDIRLLIKASTRLRVFRSV